MDRIECTEAVELMPLYYAKSLSSADTGRLMIHISECADCRAELAFIYRLSKSALSLETVVPDDVISHAFDLSRREYTASSTSASVASASKSGPMEALSRTFDTISSVITISKKVMSLAFAPLATR